MIVAIAALVFSAAAIVVAAVRINRADHQACNRRATPKRRHWRNSRRP